MSGIDPAAKLVLHCDGTDASTTFTDSSSSARTVTAVGNAQIDTAQFKFGTASGLFDGTGDFLTVPNHADFDFGSGDFTIDFWIRPHVTNVQMIPMGKRANSGVVAPFAFYFPAANPLGFYSSSNGSSFDIANNRSCGNWSADTWVHIAVVRSGSTWYTFNAGTQISTWSSSATVMVNTDLLRIGADSDGFGVNGWMDEIRVSKGVARWTADFTPPTIAYDSSFPPAPKLTLQAKNRANTYI